MRKLVRKGVQAVRDGEEFVSLPRHFSGVIPTFTQDSVARRPALEGVDDDKLIREYGLRYAQIVIESAKSSPDERRDYLQEKLNELDIQSVE